MYQKVEQQGAELIDAAQLMQPLQQMTAVQSKPATPRTLIKCLNTGSQKGCKYRGMPSEIVKHFRCVA